MDDWPAYITRAVHQLETMTDEVAEEEQIEAFASHWGGLSLDIFKQVLEEGKGEDRVLAILALGSSGLPEAPALLSPLLESPVLPERWASALALGEQQQAQARPVLEQMLFEEYWLDLPPSETPGGLWAMLLEAWRGQAAHLLARWRDPSLVVVLRQALQADWQREQALVARFGSGSPVAYACDSIAFALGQLGGFGALLHLEWPAARLRIALLHLVLGSLSTTGVLHGQNFLIDLVGFETPLKAGVRAVLAERFGYTQPEAEVFIERAIRDRRDRSRA
jgi:hypothetical protein